MPYPITTFKKLPKKIKSHIKANRVSRTFLLLDDAGHFYGPRANYMEKHIGIEDGVQFDVDEENRFVLMVQIQ